MFQPDPFDLAPASRRPPVAWLALAAGLVFATACAVPLHASLRLMARAEDARVEARKAQSARAAAATAARLAQADPAALARLRAQQDLQNRLRMSWTSLFDALEQASGDVKGAATVLSLAPSATRTDSAEISLTAIATSVPVMLTFARGLQASEQIREVRLSTQQPVTNGGVPAVRFQLSLLWVPARKTDLGGARGSPIASGGAK